MLGSVPPGSSALTFEMCLGYYTAQKACICTQIILGFPWWKQCIALTPHPLQSAKKLPLGPSRSSILHDLGSQLGSCICGSRWESYLVLAFSLWKSMQKHRPPSFLHTNTTALHDGLWLGQIVPTSSISFMCALTLSTMGRGILQNLSLKGSSSTVLISCFTRYVQPTSPGSKENMSWYSANRAAWFLSDHLSRPDKYSCWKSTSLLHSTDILVHWIPYISSRFSKVPGPTSTWGTTFTATIWVTLTPLAIVIGVAVRFFTMTATHLLLVITLV